MWKTLYDMFSDRANEQQLYHSIATVGTLLLELGEVGKRFYLKSVSESSQGENMLSSSVESESGVDSIAKSVENMSLPSASSETSKSVESSPNSDDTTDKGTDSGIDVRQSSVDNSSSLADSNHSKPDSDWSISFEQFVASLLTEQPLVTFFEECTDVTEAVAKMRNRRLIRQMSQVPEEKKKKS